MKKSTYFENHIKTKLDDFKPEMKVSWDEFAVRLQKAQLQNMPQINPTRTITRATRVLLQKIAAALFGLTVIAGGIFLFKESIFGESVKQQGNALLKKTSGIYSVKKHQKDIEQSPNNGHKSSTLNAIKKKDNVVLTDTVPTSKDTCVKKIVVRKTIYIKKNNKDSVKKETPKQTP